jgi:excinuclease ABC subunit C
MASSVDESLDQVSDPRIAKFLEQVARLPTLPGVYIMKDVDDVIIYIGKAKSLRNRVRSYFVGGDGRAQIEFLVARIHSFETILTDSDDQAYILERQLIGKHKPRYNVKLKDDKTYLSIRIDPDEQWPRLRLVRRVEHDGAQYFGPYRFGHEARSLLELINKLVPLRTCNDTVFFNRQRPCLEYQIKRCAGPCCLPVERAVYGEWIKQAIAILRGDVKRLVQDLTQQMNQAAEELQFEQAAVLRDRVTILEQMESGQRMVSSGTEDRDVFALYREERLAALCIMHVRFGRIADSSLFSFRDVEVSDSDLLQMAIEQFYEGGRDLPTELVLPTELCEVELVRDRLKQLSGHACSLVVPKQGLKLRTLQLGELNAQQHFSSTFDAETRWNETARSCATFLGLRQMPRRIECVDISNFQGSDIVGAVVVFFDGKPLKNEYRKYRISQQGKPDDFASIYEVVHRRLERGFREDNLPDLLIIDGGKGQLGAAIAARDTLGIDLEIVSLAKERNTLLKSGEQRLERVFIEGESEARVLDTDINLFRLFTMIRDEVHRFVITFHRSVRSKRVLSSVLDDIPGVGVTRKARLLKHFGSTASIARFDAEEIAKVGRMPIDLAERILSALKPTEKNEH